MWYFSQWLWSIYVDHSLVFIGRLRLVPVEIAEIRLTLQQPIVRICTCILRILKVQLYWLKTFQISYPETWLVEVQRFVHFEISLFLCLNKKFRLIPENFNRFYSCNKAQRTEKANEWSFPVHKCVLCLLVLMKPAKLLDGRYVCSNMECLQVAIKEILFNYPWDVY